MANPLYQFSLYKSPTNGVSEEYAIVGGNSLQFTVGDPIIMSGGFAATYGSVATTQPVLGIAAKTVLMSSTNQTVALVKVPYFPIDQAYWFLGGSDGELSLTTSAGNFFQLNGTGPSGQYVGVIAASVSSLATASTPALCLGVDPMALGTTGVGGGSRQGLFRFVKTIGQDGPIA